MTFVTLNSGPRSLITACLLGRDSIEPENKGTFNTVSSAKELFILGVKSLKWTYLSFVLTHNVYEIDDSCCYYTGYTYKTKVNFLVFLFCMCCCFCLLFSHLHWQICGKKKNHRRKCLQHAYLHLVKMTANKNFSEG